MAMEKCFICEKHNGMNDAARFHIITTPLISVYHMFPENGSVYLGHVFIETIRHIPSLAEMTIEESNEVGRFQMIISKVFKEFFDAEHIYSFVFGDGVPHLHIHLIPRYKGAPEEFRGVKVDEWADAPHGDAEETIVFCNKVTEKIKEIGLKLS